MHRLTVRFTIAAASFGLLLVPAALLLGPAFLLLGPAPARAAGCEVLGDPRDRAECEARAVAREAARAEVERQVGGGGAAPARGAGADASSAASSSGRSADWQAAVDEAGAVDPGQLLEPRPLAALGGIVWFLLAVRSRRRARSRASRA